MATSRDKIQVVLRDSTSISPAPIAGKAGLAGEVDELDRIRVVEHGDG